LKRLLFISFVVCAFGFAKAQNSEPDFRWSHSYYYNLNIGDSIRFNDGTVRLLAIDHQFTQLEIEGDTLNLRVSRRSLPTAINGMQVFVADNKNLAGLTPNSPAHSLLTGDALICLSDFSDRWLAKNDFIFPVSFNNGFLWRGDEDTYIFSLLKEADKKHFTSYPGIGIDLNDARGLEKHWLVAMEDCTVEWVEETSENSVCVCLSSVGSPGIYYIYDKLFNKTLEVRKSQNLQKGELIGTAWGDELWGHVLLSVVYSNDVPTFENRFSGCVNFFPQLFSLYYENSFQVSNYFSKGTIEFGRRISENGNTLNASASEEYLGKGWKPCKWNTAEKLDWISKGSAGNVRISKILFKGTSAEVTNPNDYCEYEINARKGVYRIRALVGDVEEASWQKIEFNGIDAGTFALAAGEQEWTREVAVKVENLKITVRVYFDPTDKTIAGLSELVFQQAY